jgi:hypothetical protein
LYVEVKGHAVAADVKKILAFALSREIIVLGAIPAPRIGGPDFLMFDAVQDVIRCWTVSLCVLNAAFDVGPLPFDWPAERPIDWFGPGQLEVLADAINRVGPIAGPLPPSEHVAAAYQAGRSARFEFGERG